MLNLSKWGVLFCTLLVGAAPFAALLSPGKTGNAEPFETGIIETTQTITYKMSMPAQPIQPTRVASSPAYLHPEPTVLKMKTEPKKQEKPRPKEPEKPEGRSEIFAATAYTIGKGQVPNLKGITATGTTVKKGRTIAVDPRVIPLGSLVYIESDFPGITGHYVAEDTGNAIKGKKIDVFFGWGGKGTPAYKEAMKFGNKQKLKVTIIRKGPDKSGKDSAERKYPV